MSVASVPMKMPPCEVPLKLPKEQESPGQLSPGKSLPKKRNIYYLNYSASYKRIIVMAWEVGKLFFGK
jgi:hypothetical protein